MIGIIDYGRGNLRSVEKAFAFLGVEAYISDDPKRLDEARGIVLPGVGAFGDAMKQLERRKLIDPILTWAREDRPFLGICLGCQLLFDASEESPGIEGLGIIPGEVVRFTGGVKVPHMGWNRVHVTGKTPLFHNVRDNDFFYFVHSFRAPVGANTIGAALYGEEFSAAVQKNNFYGVQFHAEKSGSAGIQVLRNFIDLC